MSSRVRTTALLLALALALAGVACAGHTGEAGPPAETAAATPTPTDRKPDDPVPVEVTTLGRGPLESVLRFSTNLEAERQLEVLARLSQPVAALLVEEGAEVAMDQPLCRLRDDEQRDQAAKVRGQLAQARRELERTQHLFAQELASEQVYNDALQRAEQLQIELQEAERQLAYATVTAPLSGIVTRRLVRLGEQVKPGQALFELVDFASLVARVFAPEKELGRLRPGQRARVWTTAAPERVHEGKLARISPAVDPKSGTVKVTVDLPRHPALLPGMYVSVELVTAVHADALRVPKRALLYDGEQVFVFRLGEANRVERRGVRPVLQDKEYIEPADGLGEGDRIVVAGQTGLKEGALVELVASPGAQPGATPTPASASS